MDWWPSPNTRIPYIGGPSSAAKLPQVAVDQESHRFGESPVLPTVTLDWTSSSGLVIWEAERWPYLHPKNIHIFHHWRFSWEHQSMDWFCWENLHRKLYWFLHHEIDRGFLYCKCSHHLILWINCFFGRTSTATLEFPENPKNKPDDMWDFTEKNRQNRKNNCSYSGNKKNIS